MTPIETRRPPAGQSKTPYRRLRVTDVCAEVRKLLHDRPVPPKAFEALARMTPSRQAEAANLMIALNRFATPYILSLVLASHPDQLVAAPKLRFKGLSQERQAVMQRDSAELDDAVHVFAPFFGRDHLDLVAATGYVRRLLRSRLVTAHLARHHPDLLSRLQYLSPAL